MGLIHRLTFVPRFIRQFFYVRFNRLLFKSAGAHIGENFNVKNRFYLKLYDFASLTIGNNFILNSGEAINPLTRNVRGCIFVNKHGFLKIGDNVGMSSPAIWCDNKIIIGDNVKIGALSMILDTDCHSLDYFERINEDKKVNTKQVIIEEGVLIGTQVILLKGSHVGAHSVIGAGSVVCGDIPANCIAAGNPCKVIKQLPKNKAYEKS